jgi:hypothetical protein
MALNNTNMILSLAMLGNANIPQEKKLAAAVGASMMPGMLGLVFPLLVARGAGAGTTPGTGTSPGTTAGTGTGDAATPPPQVTKSEEELALEREISTKVTDMGTKVDMILAKVGNGTEKTQPKH